MCTDCLCCSIKDKMGRSWRLRKDPKLPHGVCMQCWGVSTLLKVIGYHFDKMSLEGFTFLWPAGHRVACRGWERNKLKTKHSAGHMSKWFGGWRIWLALGQWLERRAEYEAQEIFKR